LAANPKENIMTRFSTFCAVSSSVAVLGFSVTGASAEVPTPKPVTPKITVHPVQPKANKTLHIDQFSWQTGATMTVPGKSNGAQEGKVGSVGEIVVKGGKKKGTTSRLYGISHVNEEAIVPGK
jgi:hypothetical protein